MIDPPAPFSPKKVLEDFLEKARAWQIAEPEDKQIKRAIEQTERALKMQAERDAACQKKG